MPIPVFDPNLTRARLSGSGQVADGAPSATFSGIPVVVGVDVGEEPGGALETPIVLQLSSNRIPVVTWKTPIVFWLRGGLTLVLS